MKIEIWKADYPFLLEALRKEFNEKVKKRLKDFIHNPPSLPIIRNSQPILLADKIEGFKYERRDT